MCKRKGFTLIELLVVIAIIALLMAILMPALQRVKKQAKTVICQAHLKEWATIFAMYTDDNNGNFPERRSGSSGYGRWMDSMRDYYISAPDIRLCPTASKLANPSMETTGVDWWGSTFVAWGRIPYWDAGGGRTASYYGEYDGWQNRSDTDAINRFCLNRHDGFINAAFVDYTVRRVGLKELFTLKWSRAYNTANAWTTAGGILPSDWKNHGNGWLSRFKDY